MSNNIEQLANMLNSDKAEKFESNKGNIDKLINSEDGQKVKSILNKDTDKLKEAVKKGDMKTLQGALNSILKTDEGKRLASQLNDMFK